MDRAWLRSLREGFLDLVFAPVCVGCDGAISSLESERYVCAVCWARARPLPPPHCPRCWNPRTTAAGFDSPCAVCPDLLPGVRAVRSAFLMEPPASELVYALKYGGWYATASPMAERMARVPLPADVEHEAQLVVPVPISKQRLRSRGYNQAEHLALAYARATGRSCNSSLLRRTRATQTQTALHPDERRANVAGAFSVDSAQASLLPGAHLILIDDVWTTGATAMACCDALLAFGARAVTVLTFARALPELTRRADSPA